MKNSIAIIITSAILVISSCGKDSIRGSGSTETQTRTVATFNYVDGNADIKIHIAHGSTASLELRGYKNLLNITESYVVNGKLTLKYKNEYHNVKNSNVEAYIVIPDLAGASTNGNGNMWIDGFLNGNSLDAKINGSSEINISNSQYDYVSLDVNGSGNFRAAGLQSKICNSTIHGSGDIEIAVSDKLKARIYGSGNIRYWGNPQVDASVSGSGNVTRQ
ncbi:MAG: DUF2807 domain-containing protein [Bacteroidetes bacterium]|nr:DUF2807 domain-containing protein [Bacteroidota bacterium]